MFFIDAVASLEVTLLFLQNCAFRKWIEIFSESVVTWESEIFGPYFNVVADAIGPETDFTLETNVKEWGKKPTEQYFDSTIWFHYLGPFRLLLKLS